MSRSYILIVTFVVGALLLYAMPVYAAFPMQPEPVYGPSTHETFGQKVRGAVARYTSPKAPEDAGSADKGTLGILSFAFGTASFLALVAGIVTGGSAILLLWPAFGIAAIVLGAMGLNRKNNGLAIAGFVLGLVETAIFLLALLVAVIAFNNYK